MNVLCKYMDVFVEECIFQALGVGAEKLEVF